MDTNDSEATNQTSLEDPSSNRYSKRVRKPIKLYFPEIVHSKAKKHEFDVKCEISKSKGFSNLAKKLVFSVGSNLSSFNVVKKFLRKAKCEIPECRFIYFSEESQKWKRLKSTKVLEPGVCYKIRAYKPKKMDKRNLGQIKKNVKKADQNVKTNNLPSNAPSNPSEATIQNLMMWNMYMAMMYMNPMNMPAYNYYSPN